MVWGMNFENRRSCPLIRYQPGYTNNFSPLVPVDVIVLRFRTVVNEVTPPNFCLAHLTSSSSSVGNCSVWTLLWCWLPRMVIVESLFIWKEEPKSCQLVSLNTICNCQNHLGPERHESVCYNNTESGESAFYLFIFTLCLLTFCHIKHVCPSPLTPHHYFFLTPLPDSPSILWAGCR